MGRKLLVASTNKGKIAEVKDLMSDLKLEVVGLEEFPQASSHEVVEDGNTFQENALKKARVRARQTGLLTLADDSGLVVDYLDGRPGIRSARYAGEDADDRDNNRKLLRELEGVCFSHRDAHFECAAALVDPESGDEYIVKGSCSGYILEEPRGEYGFGYDPLFFVPSYGKTMAELSPAVKNSISHRAEAMEKMKKVIIDRI
ncbi:MAG: XTP/dITP diphosphatase [Halanaerobiaceae bacterium]